MFSLLRTLLLNEVALKPLDLEVNGCKPCSSLEHTMVNSKALLKMPSTEYFCPLCSPKQQAVRFISRKCWLPLMGS